MRYGPPPARLLWCEDDGLPPPDERQTISIHEAPGPIATGLLSADGMPIYRYPETVPMGFHPPGDPKAR
jgi:hypothetical protein